MFAKHGLSEIMMLDNGVMFTTAGFKEIYVRQWYKHIFTSPYHPSSNGLAECAVAMFRCARITGK